MDRNLLSRSLITYLIFGKAWRYLYAALIMMCGAAYSQPTMVSQIPNASKNFISVNGSVYYSVSDALYRVTAVSPPVLVRATGQPILKIYNIVMGSTFFFVTQNGSAQTLWRTDGTTANTTQVFTEGQILPLLVYNSNLFLMVSSESTGKELWKVNSSYNATMVSDINPGPASGFFGDLVISNGHLYLLAYSGESQDLWQTDGSAAGTVMSVNLEYTGFYYLTSGNNIMYFTRSYADPANIDENKIAELWKSDGTIAGTTMVKQYPSDYTYNSLSDFTPFKGKMYFIHTTGYPPFDYLMVTDGTEVGTKQVDFVAGDGYVQRVINADDIYLLYNGDSQAFLEPIKKFDGTTVSTVHDWSYSHEASPEQVSLTYTGGRAFFIDDSDSYNGGGSGSSELWQADLAEGTDQSMENLYGTSMDNSGNIVANGRSIYFTRRVYGNLTLWYYNPDATATSSACKTAGYIEREKWTDISGFGVSTIPVSSQPNSIAVLSNFASQQNEGDNYGARVRGYVCAPESGNYVFYISSDDNSELWLSTDENPSNKRLIASSKWTNYNEWTKYPTQQSAEITLVKGNKYYIEALHKEATGADHLSVGWQLPSGTMERPIAGARLSPFKRNFAPEVVITRPADNESFVAPATINIQAFASDDAAVAKVSFYSAGVLLGQDMTDPYTYQWQNVPAGNYIIEARATDNEGYVKSDFQPITVDAPPSCSGTGNIRQEIWVNVPGSDVRTFDFSSNPNGGPAKSFSSFETGQYYTNNYASRMRGYVCVPQSGSYTFWISSDDYSELYLSTDESEGNKKLIAWVYGATPFRNYDKYSTQRSALVTLQAGRKYYIEARHKEGSGNDFVSVGWQLPNGTMERPIPGNRLIPIIAPPNTPPSITIASPQPNQNYSSPASVKISAEVTDPDGVNNVQFDVVYGSTSTRLATFNSPPYEFTWSNVPPGSYQLIVSASDTRSTGTSKSVFFSVEKTPCAGAGKIIREVWTGVTGTSVSNIPVNSPPTAKVELSSFATPNYYGNDYGSRIRGYVCAPMSGVYTFYISSDDNSELWLSDNDDPANKKLIASVSGATAVNQWNKYSTQMSGSKNLVQGQRYYIEVLHKEGGGADHVEVGWDLPQGAPERPIPGNRLIPFEDPATTSTALAQAVPMNAVSDDGISIYPNPAASGSQITISLAGEFAKEFNVNQEFNVNIVSATGVSVQSETFVNSTTGVVIDLKPSIPSGIYLISVSDNKRRWWRKVQIK